MSSVTPSPLRRVATLTAQLDALVTERDLAVSRALAAGATWVGIGEALGVSPQASHKRLRVPLGHFAPPGIMVSAVARSPGSSFAPGPSDGANMRGLR